MSPLTYLKLGGGIVVLVAAGLLFWRVNVWHDKAQERDQAVEDLKDAREDFAKQTAQRDADQKAAEADRAKLAGDLEATRARFANLPPVQPKTLVQTVEVPGAPCPAARISDSFRELWNGAATP